MKNKKINIREYKELGSQLLNIVPKKQLEEIMSSLLLNTKKYSKFSKINKNKNKNLDNLLHELRKKIKKFWFVI